MTGRLVFEGVRKAFRPGADVLDGVDLDIPLGGFTYVVGRSGEGKSVLCKLAVGLLDPDEGHVRLGDATVDALPRRDRVRLRRHYPYVVQGAALLDWLTLEQNATLAAPSAPPEEIREALAHVGLAELAHSRPPDNGPGVNKRAALARALLLRPRYLLLDEPTTGLDRRAADDVNAVLQKLRGEGLGALVVSHDYGALERMADAVVVLAQGRVAFHGAPAEFFASAKPEVRALTAPAQE